MKKLVLIVFLNTILLTFASERIIGVWDWKPNEGKWRSSSKVLFQQNGIAIYKLPSTEPIKAQWKLTGDTLEVTSANFIWDCKYFEVNPQEYILWYDSEYSPYNNGKLLDSKGAKEVYLVKDSLLLPVGYNESGLLKRSNMDSTEFSKYIPSRRKNGMALDHYCEIEEYVKSKNVARTEDSILNKAINSGITSEPPKNLYLLENIPQKIDSIEFKFIDYFHTKYDYFAIDRKAFDLTFEYLKEYHPEEYELIHLVTKDSVIIHNFCELLKESIPYPTEAVVITPNNAWRQSQGYTEKTHGIYITRNQNNDPIAVRGKIVLHSCDDTLICYLSPWSIDYKSHRYSVSRRMFLAFFWLNIYLSKEY